MQIHSLFPPRPFGRDSASAQVRNDQREGLIRSKNIGAHLTTGTHIFFLDGHCKPRPGSRTPPTRGTEQERGSRTRLRIDRPCAVGSP